MPFPREFPRNIPLSPPQFEARPTVIWFPFSSPCILGLAWAEQFVFLFVRSAAASLPSSPTDSAITSGDTESLLLAMDFVIGAIDTPPRPPTAFSSQPEQIYSVSEFRSLAA